MSFWTLAILALSFFLFLSELFSWYCLSHFLFFWFFVIFIFRFSCLSSSRVHKRVTFWSLMAPRHQGRLHFLWQYSGNAHPFRSGFSYPSAIGEHLSRSALMIWSSGNLRTDPSSRWLDHLSCHYAYHRTWGWPWCWGTMRLQKVTLLWTREDERQENLKTKRPKNQK